MFKGLLNPYRLTWLAIVALFVLALWWLLFIRPQNPIFTQISPKEVQRPDVDVFTPPAESIDEKTGPMSLDVSKANMTISSTNGELVMSVWADKANKKANVTTIKQGALEFKLKDRDTLLLKVTDAVLTLSPQTADLDTASASGNLVGELVNNGHRFSAEKLSWNRATNTLVARRVLYVGPNVQVEGQEMHINLVTNQVTFEGLVKAGIDQG